MPLHNHETASTTSARSGWYGSPDETGQVPTPILRSWLTEPGLLTARLRASCTAGFSLRVLEHSNPANETAVKRRIFLRCGEQNCVYAETLIPDAAIAAHPWLAMLGDEPLGERLAMEPGVTRSEFRFSLLSSAELPSELADIAAMLWARQSEFAIGATRLTVTEIFLPALESEAG